MKEKIKYHVDKKSLALTDAEIKQIIEYEKKIKWTLDLISELKETKIGDVEKLNQISRLLKRGKNIDEGNKQYLKEMAWDLNQIKDSKKKITWMLDAIMKLQEIEVRRYKKLEALSQAVEQGKPVSKRDTIYLNAHYEKLQSTINKQKSLEWTMQIIEKLKQSGIVDAKRLDAIKQLLEDEIPVPENDIEYLKEVYQPLSQTPDQKNKIKQAVSMINQLQEMEIGNHERLAAIKKILEEGRDIPESEINYFEKKCKLLMMVKKSEKRYEATNDENKTEKVD